MNCPRETRLPGWSCGLLLALLGACSADSEAPVPTGAAPKAAASSADPRTETSGIDWFKGSIDEAFADAARLERPVLLYWGASWCPPCHQLKVTLFERADFQAKTREFIPVYLDGDNPGAQQWGERFKVVGYPTFVVLDREQREIMRIAGSMDLNQYANVLDLALENLSPVNELLASRAQRELSAAECQRLAYNAWVLDDMAEAELGPQAERLAQAAQRCAPDSIERARLHLVAAYFASGAAAEKLKAGQAPDAVLNLQMEEISALLGKPAIAGKTADALNYLGEPFFLAVKTRDAELRQRFVESLGAVLLTGAGDARFAAADQLAMYRTLLQAQKVLTGSVDLRTRELALARIDNALAGEQSDYARSGLINSALHIYSLLGMNEKAYAVVEAELPRAVSPYYFKADLAAIAETLGLSEDALRWAAEAYAESKGAATRFQWGNLYLGALIRLAPADSARIQQVGVQVLSELQGDDRIYQRARTRLTKLDSALREWAAADTRRRITLSALRKHMNDICAGIAPEEAARRSCDAFLANAA